MKIEEFLTELHQIKGQVDQLLVQRKENIPGIGSIQLLEFISDELAKIADQLNTGTSPPKEVRRFVSAHFVMDSWPAKDELAKRIVRLDYLYRKALEL